MGGGDLTENPLIALIDAAYASATEPGRWPDFVARVGDFLGGPAALRVISGDALDGRHLAASTFDPTFIDAYARHYAGLDPWIRRDSLARAPVLVVDEELLTMAELDRTEFYADWMRPQDLRRAVRCRARLRADLSVDLVSLRPEQRGPYSHPERSVLAALLPHLQRAVGIAERLGGLAVQAASLAAFETLGAGILLVESDRRLVFANGHAERVLRAGEGLWVAGGRLAAAPAVQDRLAAAIVAATGERGRAGAMLSVPRPRAGTPLSLAIGPLDPRDRPGLAARPTVLVVLGAPEFTPGIGEEALRAHYDLTPAEARLVAALCAGETLADHAAASGTSLNTVKTHLKSVFGKMDETRQAGLVRTVMANPALRIARSFLE